MQYTHIRFIVGNGKTEKWQIAPWSGTFILRPGYNNPSRVALFRASNGGTVSALFFEKDEGILWEYCL